MKSISLKTKVITGIITGGMLLSSVSQAFATTTKVKDTNVKANSRTECKQPKAELESTLKLGVSSKIITQSESDKILAYKNSEIKVKIGKPDFYKELVTNNILSQAKADALEASAKIQRETQMKKNMETNLAKLVTDKTITQDQADKIKATIIKEEASKKAEMGKIKTMTEAQRTTYMNSNKANHVSALKSLVDAGTITQVQADKVGSCCFGGHGKGGKNEFRQPKAEKESTLKLAVSANIITQSESDKILAYENSKTKDKTEKPDFYKKLVTNNILSQAKADALEANAKIQRDTQRQQKIATKLAKLVTDKSITQDQADKIKAVIIKVEAAKKVEREKMETMTVAERTTYMKNNKANHVSALKALVDAGTITQAQADKVSPRAISHIVGLSVK